MFGIRKNGKFQHLHNPEKPKYCLTSDFVLYNCDHPSSALPQIVMSGAATTAATSRFASFMNHPAGPSLNNLLQAFRITDSGSRIFIGPKTVFFWAPVMKWCLVAAGLKDIQRPVEKLSVSQNVGTWCLTFRCYRIAELITLSKMQLSYVMNN